MAAASDAAANRQSCVSGAFSRQISDQNFNLRLRPNSAGGGGGGNFGARGGGGGPWRVISYLPVGEAAIGPDGTKRKPLPLALNPDRVHGYQTGEALDRDCKLVDGGVVWSNNAWGGGSSSSGAGGGAATGAAYVQRPFPRDFEITLEGTVAEEQQALEKAHAARTASGAGSATSSATGPGAFPLGTKGGVIGGVRPNPMRPARPASAGLSRSGGNVANASQYGLNNANTSALLNMTTVTEKNLDVILRNKQRAAHQHSTRPGQKMHRPQTASGVRGNPPPASQSLVNLAKTVQRADRGVPMVVTVLDGPPTELKTGVAQRQPANTDDSANSKDADEADGADHDDDLVTGHVIFPRQDPKRVERAERAARVASGRRGPRTPLQTGRVTRPATATGVRGMGTADDQMHLQQMQTAQQMRTALSSIPGPSGSTQPGACAATGANTTLQTGGTHTHGHTMQLQGTLLSMQSQPDLNSQMNLNGLLSCAREVELVSRATYVESVCRQPFLHPQLRAIARAVIRSAAAGASEGAGAGLRRYLRLRRVARRRRPSRPGSSRTAWSWRRGRRRVPPSSSSALGRTGVCEPTAPPLQPRWSRARIPATNRRAYSGRDVSQPCAADA